MTFTVEIDDGLLEKIMKGGTSDNPEVTVEQLLIGAVQVATNGATNPQLITTLKKIKVSRQEK